MRHCLAREIPPGDTRSYGAIAARIGSPGSARAVGQALGRNPFAIIVPCHRVVAANGKLGGFSANGGVTTKAHLLSLEAKPVPATKKAEMGFSPKTALDHLRRADPELGRFIDSAGPFDLRINPADSVFGMLAEAIIYQQLTAKAASTIFGRVCEVTGNGKRPKPKDVLATSETELRGAGLSRAKTLALLDLAEKADSGELPTLAKIRQLPDDDIIETLTKVRGVGRWTAEMFLIFRLGRPDVLPLDDYGLRRGYATVFGKNDLPSKEELTKAGEKWAPYRTAASWYLWKAAEPPALQD